MHYIQEVITQMTFNVVNLVAELEQAFKAITIPLFENTEQME